MPPTKRVLVVSLGVGVVFVAVNVLGAKGGEPRASRTTASPAAPKRSVLIVAAGDIACDPSGPRGADRSCRDSSTADLIERINPDHVLTLGDNQYGTAELSSFLAAFASTWGRFKSIIRPSVGNHDYAAPEAAGYFEYFGERAGRRGGGYYSFDLGGWHLIALNSNCGIVGCLEDSAQARWLLSDVKAHPARCTLAFWHHPLFTSGKHGGDYALTYLWDTLDQAGAEVVLSGHDHLYERFRPSDATGRPSTHGIRQFVVGTGGHSLSAFVSPLAGSEVRYNADFGVLILTLSPGSYAWEFRTVSGEPVDSGTSPCV